MDRHTVISFSSQRFNSQLLKASHGFQRVSPGEEEKEVAKESIFHHKPDMGEAVPGLMPLENGSLTVRQSRAVSNRQRRSCCRALGSPRWAQAYRDQSVPGTLEPVFAPGGQSVAAKDMELTSSLCIPESIPEPW